MKKLVPIFLLQMFCSICVAFAQNVSVTVDNQYPGWLSSKIPYKDQESVKDLTVTGYLNGTDIKFIRELLTNRQLTHLDLTDANIVAGGETYYQSYTTKDNTVSKYMFYNSNGLSYLALPKTIRAIGGEYYNSIDTLIVGGELKILNMDDVGMYNIRHLCIREGTDSIAPGHLESTATVYDKKQQYEKIHLATTIKSLGMKTFCCNDLDINSDINLDSLTFIDHLALYQTYIKGDTIRIPKIKTWHTCSFGIHQNSVIYIPKEVKNIDLSCFDRGLNDMFHYYCSNTFCGNLIIHTESETPIQISCSNTNDTSKGYGILKSATVYVPKGCSEAYKKSTYIGGSNNPWSYATIIEEKVPVSGITLDKEEISFSKPGEAKQIVATVMPEDADNKNVLWTSSDTNVASVENGKVTCTGYGTATISATTEEGGFVATCLVTATRPEVLPTSITISQTNLTVNKGESTTLYAIIQPADADNKDIEWSTEDNSVADVDNNGIVTGMKAGTTKVFATAKANGVKAECAVSVLQPVTGITLSENSISLSEIGSSIQLTAYVQPEDASNKNVIWASSDTKVAIVSNGKVVCTGFGTTVISAITEDGGYMATCVINAINGIEEITNINSNTLYKIYDSTGREIRHPINGLNIIKSNKGKVIKFNVYK